MTFSSDQLRLLHQAGLDFNSTLELAELLPRVFDRVMEDLDAEAGSIWLRQGDSLVCELARGPVSDRIQGMELPWGAGIVGDVGRRGEPGGILVGQATCQQTGHLFEFGDKGDSGQPAEPREAVAHDSRRQSEFASRP